MASRVISFPYGLALSGALLSGALLSGAPLSGAPLSGALGDASGLIDGESDGDGEPDGLGEGVATTGNAFAITLRILAIVAGVR
jgi:uncharacterized protein YjbI with pentapeptide repeats